MMKLKLQFIAFVLAIFAFSGCKPENNENDNTSGNGQSNTTEQSGTAGNDNTSQNNNDNNASYPENIDKEPKETDLQIPFSIRGTLTNGEGAEVVLDRMKPGSIEALQSTIVNSNAEFSFSGLLPQPGLYQLRVNQRVIHLYLRGGDVRIITDMHNISDYKVSGSPETTQLRELYVLLNEANQEMKEVQDRMQNEKNNAKLLQLHDSIPIYSKKFEREKTQKLKAFIKEVDTSLVAILAANYMPVNNNEVYLMEISDKFTVLAPENPTVIMFNEKVDGFRHLTVGKEAPNISLETPEGKTVELKDLRGKYVLIDFWASWCAPCRQENPNMLRVYNRYKAKGFEIYGVSLDSKQNEWVQAIEEDNVNWVHVSDLLGNESGVPQVYNVAAIPTTFLLDKEGRIIDKNLRAADLEKKLAKLLR